jgi:hypothetical protein
MSLGVRCARHLVSDMLRWIFLFQRIFHTYLIIFILVRSAKSCVRAMRMNATRSR